MDAREAKSLIEIYLEELRARRARLGQKLRPLGFALGIGLAAGGAACSDDDNLPPMGDAYGAPDINRAVDAYGGIDDVRPYDLPKAVDIYGGIDDVRPAEAGPDAKTDLPQAVDAYGVIAD